MEGSEEDSAGSGWSVASPGRSVVLPLGAQTLPAPVPLARPHPKTHDLRGFHWGLVCRTAWALWAASLMCSAWVGFNFLKKENIMVEVSQLTFQ